MTAKKADQWLTDGKAKAQPKPKQDELFKAETTWFHVFKDMIDSGDMAKIDGSSIKVYLVIKSHTNFATGRAFPAIETICKDTGLSESQVLRCIKILEEHGYITKKKDGRRNIYTLKEKVQIVDDAGKPAAVATWDYIPNGVREAVADLRNVLVTGDVTGELAGAKIVHIERLQVTINNVHSGGTNTNINVQQAFWDNLKAMPPEFAEQVKAAFMSKAWAEKAEKNRAP